MITPPSSLPTQAPEQSPYPPDFPPGEAGGGGFTILQIWYMLRAHLWLSMAIFVVCVGSAFLVIKKLPKSYESMTALIVNSENSDPLAGRNQGFGQSYTFFPTQVELINSNAVLRPVIDRLKLQTDERFTGGFVGDEKALSDHVLASLRGSIRVQQGGGSQLLYISATASDPVLAADIANAVSDEYLHQASQRTNAPAKEQATRYSEQLEELKDKVDAAQSRLSSFRERYGMADLRTGIGGDSEGAALSDLEGKLRDAQNARRQLEGQQLTPEAVALRTTLGQLESELNEARVGLGPRHPRIQELQTKIDSTRKELVSNSSMQLSRARELEAKYEAEVAAERRNLLARRDVQDQGNKLMIEHQLAQDAYAAALRGLDQVQFRSEGNYKDVTVVDRAEPPLRASGRNKMKLFLAAIVASFGLAVGGPFAYELLLNRRIRCRDDLERHFGIVMLAHLGRMSPTAS